VGRGPVVDQWALFRALRDNRIAGAAIDVWYRYPEGDDPQLPSDAPFHELSNVILTPHMSGYTEGTMRHRYAAIAENIRRLADNEPLDNVVWPRP
jgi:phosphoglycerate dehydrogenase-like enzyme